MLDVPVPEVLLDCPGVVPSVRQVEARRVSKHVRVDRERELRESPRPGRELPDVGRGERSSALREENVGRVRIGGPEPPQSA
jgi:hypothetical protein